VQRQVPRRLRHQAQPFGRGARLLDLPRRHAERDRQRHCP
jgi:hypothetical protein